MCKKFRIVFRKLCHFYEMHFKKTFLEKARILIEDCRKIKLERIHIVVYDHILVMPRTITKL